MCGNPAMVERRYELGSPSENQGALKERLLQADYAGMFTYQDRLHRTCKPYNADWRVYRAAGQALAEVRDGLLAGDQEALLVLENVRDFLGDDRARKLLSSPRHGLTPDQLVQSAAGLSRDGNVDEARRLYDFVFDLVGEEEARVLRESYRLSFTPLPELDFVEPRVRCGFAQ